MKVAARMMPAKGCPYRADTGQEVVEYALVLPLLLLIVLGIVEFSLAFMAYTTIANAAREGARAGVLPSTSACDAVCRDAQVLVAAQELTVGLDSDALSIVVSRPTASTVHVQVDYTVALITGPIIAALGGGGTVPLQVVATMQIE